MAFREKRQGKWSFLHNLSFTAILNLRLFRRIDYSSFNKKSLNYLFAIEIRRVQSIMSLVYPLETRWFIDKVVRIKPGYNPGLS